MTAAEASRGSTAVVLTDFPQTRQSTFQREQSTEFRFGLVAQEQGNRPLRQPGTRGELFLLEGSHCGSELLPERRLARHAPSL